MPLAQDQLKQIIHKIQASDFPLRNDSLKQLLNEDPKDLWQINISEDEKLESGNDSEVEKYKKSYCHKSEFKCNEDRHYVDEVAKKEWQEEKGRFEWRQNENGEYRESEYSDDNRDERRYCYETCQRNGSRNYDEARTSEHRCHICDCCQQYSKPKQRLLHGYDEKGITDKTCRRSLKDDCERMTQSKTKLLKKGCNGHGQGCSEHSPNRVRPFHCFDCNETHRCNEWSSRYQSERTQKIPVQMLMYSKPFKNVHRSRKIKTSEEDIYRNNLKPECCHRAKKILDSFEELPVVDESLEQLSDATYKASSYTNFTKPRNSESNLPMLPMNKNEEVKNVCGRTSSWMLCDKAAERALNDVMSYDIYQEKYRKTRSRRTRMNRSRYIKWKKALIHPVVEGSRKEMVGVMVWGQNGPEYYSKLSNKKSYYPFRKSRSFPEDPLKNSDFSFNLESKDVYFSASEPGRKLRNEPKTPEEDNSIEQQTAKFNKNLEELVNKTNENFLRSFSIEQSQGDSTTNQREQSKQTEEKNITGESKEETTKKSQSMQLMPSELLSSRVPKSNSKMERPGRDIFAFNVESKIMADALNERAKKFKLNQLSQKDDHLDELEKKFPPKKVDKETKDANLSLWGMKINEEELNESTENNNKQKNLGGEGDGNDIGLRLRIPLRLKTEANECQQYRNKNEEIVENEMTESAMEKLCDELHRERRKKYYGSLRKESEQDKPKTDETPMKKEETGETGETGETQSPKTEKLKVKSEHEQVLFDLFKNLVKDGCAISEKESENLQKKILQTIRYEADMNKEESVISEVDSKTSDEVNQEEEPSSSKKNPKETIKSGSKKSIEIWDECQSDGINKKFFKLKSMKNEELERKTWKKLQKDLKGKKKQLNVDKMRLKLIREALPSMAAENEAAHLKQLKKYIHRFIDGVELKISSLPETRKRNKTKTRDTSSTGSSEVRVDAKKVIDLVSDPYKRITSDVTINMARKLTDALVQETNSNAKNSKHFRSSSKTRKNSVETEEASISCPTTSGSDRDEEPETSYMNGLKKMRNDHIVNIMMEVKRLKEVIRFLDRCNRLKL